jgi:integrase
VTKALARRPQLALDTAEIGGELGAYVTIEEVHRARALARSPVRELIGFLWVTGARISEALAVRMSNLDIHHQAATVATLKRRKPTARTCPVPGEYFAELLGLVVARIDVNSNVNPNVRLFPLSRSWAFELIRRALLAAGVDRARARPHALRHGHAHHSIRAGVSLNLIQRQLGHSDIRTTSRYLRATAEDVRRVYKGIPW